MLREFKAFLLKENVISLALAVVIGGALGKVVTALVEQIIMPFVGAVTPGGAWRELVVQLGPVKFGIGTLLGALLDFIIIGFVVWRISKIFIKPTPAAPTKQCDYCRMIVDVAATRCPHCTSQLGVVSVPPDARVPGAMTR